MSPPESVVEPPRKAALAFIFITVVLDVLALGIILPVLPALVVEFLGGSEGSGAVMYGLFGATWALMQFIFSPVMGSISDRFGRRPVILLSNFCLGFDYILMAIAPSLGWLFVGRVISGIAGAAFTPASAYISDVTPPEKRAAGFGLLGAAFSLGFVLGPFVGGELGRYDLRYPFWAAAAMTLLNATYGIFVLPESLRPENRRAFSWRRANPVGSLKLLRSHPELFGLATVLGLFYLAHESLPSTWVLYTQYRFGWKPEDAGRSLAFAGVCSMIVQAGLVGMVVRRLGERRSILTGLSFGIAAFLIYAAAPTGAVVLAGIPVMSLWGFFGPAAQQSMTKRVSVSEQGQLQGAITGVRGIVGFFGPLIFPFSFATAISISPDYELPGAPYFLASGLMLIGLILAWRVTRPQPEEAVKEPVPASTAELPPPIEIESEAMPNISIDAPR